MNAGQSQELEAPKPVSTDHSKIIAKRRAAMAKVESASSVHDLKGLLRELIGEIYK